MLRAVWEWLWPPHCDHQWKQMHETELWHVEHGVRLTKEPARRIFVYVCTKCGRWHKTKLP